MGSETTYSGTAETGDAGRLLAEQQAALRRVATLVAEGATASELFTAVVEEVVAVLDVPAGWLCRYEPDRSVSVLASLNDPRFAVGSRWPLESPSLPATILETGQPARIDDYSQLGGTVEAMARGSGYGSALGVPITVDGVVWGLICVGTPEREPLPADTEPRLRDFTELVATAISKAQADDDLRRLVRRQAALTRVATIVAEGVPAAELFTALTYEVVHALEVPAVSLVRYEADRSTVVLASLNAPDFPVGGRLPLDGRSLSTKILESGRPARAETELRSEVGVPIVVDGQVWGLIRIAATGPEPLLAHIEASLRDFTELVATAISKTESRDSLRRVVAEQAALRTVATLVAEGAAPVEVFSSVAREVARILDVSAVSIVRFESDTWSVVVASVNDPGFPVDSRWPLQGPSLNATVFETGKPAQIDYSELPGAVAAAARAGGIRVGVAVPIVVEGKVWGMIAAGERHRRHALPAFAGSYTGRIVLSTASPRETQARLAAFTELVATAISKAQAHDDLRGLAMEQAALRRVATLVAESAPSGELFAAVAKEVALVVGVPTVTLTRFEPDRSFTVVGCANNVGFPVGSRWPIDGPSLAGAVLDTGRAARIDDYSNLPGTIAATMREASMHSSVGVPIVVDGRVWGHLSVSATDARPLPADSEHRLYEFTELVGTAISKAESRDALSRLADEQAALHRVAALVAEGTDSPGLFDAVCAEAGQLVGASTANLSHYTPEGFNETVAGWSLRNTHVPVGTRFPLTPDTVGGVIVRTHTPARVDSWEGASSELARVVRERGIRSSLGAPVVVEGQLWGALVAATDQEEPLPPGTEFRLARFTELVATAISNLQARNDLRSLADEQAALRRVATLVAEGATPELLFSAVAREAAQVLHVAAASLERYEADGTGVTLALARAPDWEIADSVAYPGRRWPYDPGGLLALVWDTGRAARVDDYSEVGGAAGDAARTAGFTSTCATPITVDGKLWGLIRVYSRQGKLPEGTESRLYLFTELVATALSNAAARAEVVASRARIVAAGDEARRRIERNLHDGTQQRLIALGLDLQRVRATIYEDRQAADLGLERAARDLESVIEDMRELSRGLHPALLSRGGLGPSLRALARKSPIHVDLNVNVKERPPASVETGVYYIVSEALTNAIKHSDASSISVAVAADDALLHATISDDGVGGAVADRGSGLTGLGDRVQALGGRFALESPPGHGTTISVELPIATPPTP
jgi:GAF domain-containing protein